jgi:hypothetical protein
LEGRSLPSKCIGVEAADAAEESSSKKDPRPGECRYAGRMGDTTENGLRKVLSCAAARGLNGIEDARAFASVTAPFAPAEAES